MLKKMLSLRSIAAAWSRHSCQIFRQLANLRMSKNFPPLQWFVGGDFKEVGEGKTYRKAFSDTQVEDLRDVVDSGQVYEKWNEIRQFRVVDVIEPRRDRHCVGGVKDVARRRVVDDDCVLEIPTELT